VTGAAGATEPAPAVREYDRWVMASPLRAVIVREAGGPDCLPGADPDAAWEAVSNEFDEVDRALSRFRGDSDATELNGRAGDGSWVEVGDRLYWALAASCRAWRLTDGAFDPRVFRDLERLGYAGAPVGTRSSGPDALAQQPRSTFAATGTDWLDRDPRTKRVRIAAPVDFGGIGKGLAVRWAFRRLAVALGSEPGSGSGCGAMIDAGGDILLAAPSPDGGAWSIGIEDPAGGEAPIAVVTMWRGAICTSSIRKLRWTGPAGRPVHHLIDPSTGDPGGNGMVSVTVAAADPAWAEVWSKALFLTGPGRIAERARQLGLAAWWLADDGVLSMTPAARQVTAWTR
jgi:FAD:protein FMN transferase